MVSVPPWLPSWRCRRVVDPVQWIHALLLHGPPAPLDRGRLLRGRPRGAAPPPPPPTPSSSRPTYQGPADRDDRGLRREVVALRLDRFGMRIEDAMGHALLDTFDGDSKVEGDTARAYGALGATYHATAFKIADRGGLGPRDRHRRAVAPRDQRRGRRPLARPRVDRPLRSRGPGHHDPPRRRRHGRRRAGRRLGHHAERRGAGRRRRGDGAAQPDGPVLRAAAGRALLRPRRALRHRRPARHPLRVLGRGGRHRAGRERAPRPRQPRPQRAWHDVRAHPLLPLHARLRPLHGD